MRTEDAMANEADDDSRAQFVSQTNVRRPTEVITPTLRRRRRRPKDK